MKVYLAADHAGFELKNKIKEWLQRQGYEVTDCGADVYDKNDDYPDFISKAATQVSKDPENRRGLIFGGSGQGEAMTANKYKGVRCALFYTPVLAKEAVDIEGRQSRDPFEIIKLSREHNGANMLCLGVRFLKEGDIFRAVQIWLETPVSNDKRHQRRVEKINFIEKNV